MNFREIIVSIGCFAAAVGLGFGKPARAGDVQSGNEPIARENERCAAFQAGAAPAEEAAGCERSRGHVRVEFGPRIPNVSVYGHPGTSPVAVRIDDGAPSRSHLRLPDGDSGLSPYAR